MSDLRYSKEFNRVVETRDTLTAEEALTVLTDELLGRDYYIADPVGAKQVNAIIVEDILKKYKKHKK